MVEYEATETQPACELTRRRYRGLDSTSSPGHVNHGPARYHTHILLFCSLGVAIRFATGSLLFFLTPLGSQAVPRTAI